MADDHITVYSAEEVAQMTAQTAYMSRVATVLLKSGAAPVILDTIDDIMTDYGLIQPKPEGGEDAAPAPA